TWCTLLLIALWIFLREQITLHTVGLAGLCVSIYELAHCAEMYFELLDESGLSFRWNHDSMRIPRSIPEAVCPDKCISISGAPDDTLNSLEIHQQILVLKINETRGCLPVYRVETLNVTVGCTCVNPIVVNS
uniref:Uncharacterized protein n=1 Tax=Erpetoichthys calabaricus TaxID=27687 RepID=A0A8C4RWJ3_ERPCA